MKNLKIYFAASIRGGRNQATVYGEIIKFLRTFGLVYTEHIGNEEQIEFEEAEYSEKEIHDRDMRWLEQSDVVIAEVTNPSLGVGYEIAHAARMWKPVLALFDRTSGNKLSAMIAGSGSLTLVRYETIKELFEEITRYMDPF